MKNHIASFAVFALLFVPGILFLTSCSKKDNIPGSTGNIPVHISSFAPETGVSGTSVTITGTGFSASVTGNTITFNGKQAKVVTATDSSLVVTVPVGAGTGKISVKAANGTDNTTTEFDYLLSVSTLAGDGTKSFKDGADSIAEFNFPYGAAVDASGNVYIADQGNNLIRKITPSGVTSTLAGDHVAALKNANTGAGAEFNQPQGITIDASGNLYVGDTENGVIRKITTAGVVSTLAGNGIHGFKDSTAADSEFIGPSGIAVDAAGNVYVGDYQNNRIRKITPGGIVSTLAGNGNAGFKNGSGSAAEFNAPVGVAVDASGNVYVADAGNNMIRKITPDGTVSTLAGDGNQAFKDGPAAQAQFYYPLGVAIDASGTLYVADFLNDRIRKITLAGVVSTLAGSGASGHSDGDATQAEFGDPTAITIDASGALYVTELRNYVRKIQ